MADNTQLVVQITAKLDNIERQLKKVGKLADDAVNDVEQKFARANPSIGTTALIASLKGAIAGLGIERLVSGLIEANHELAEIGETAKRVGIDVGRLQELRKAAGFEGVSASDFTSGIEGLAKKINDAAREETDLSKFLEANNIKIKDRNGALLSTNQVLEHLANLVRGAATEFDKIKIAEIAGLTKDWVGLLERGAAGMNDLANEARRAGGILDEATIQKAQEFDKAWREVATNFATFMKAAIADILPAINALIGAASSALQTLNTKAAAAVAVAEFKAAGAGGMSIDSLKEFERIDPGGVTATDATMRRRLAEARELNRETARAKALSALPFDAGKKGGGTTRFASKGGGGGGDGKTDAEKAKDSLDRYIESLVRQEAVEKALLETVGMSEAARKAATEVARAQVNIEKLNGDEKQKYIDKLRDEVIALETLRAKRLEAEAALRAINDATRFFGDLTLDVFDRLVSGGEKFKDVMVDVGKQIAKAALQAALLGSGPLGGLFGLGPKSPGGVGGLFGLLGAAFGGARAIGGPVSSGKGYIVGERGPEWFAPATSGRVIPMTGAGSSSITNRDNRVIHIDARGAQAGVAEQIVAALSEYDQRLPARIKDHQMRGRL